MNTNTTTAVSDLFKKLAISFAIGWVLIILFQAFIWLKQDAWIAIPFGKYDISLSQILGWGTVFSLIVKWIIDHNPKRSK